jgi:hypothetical protein
VAAGRASHPLGHTHASRKGALKQGSFSMTPHNLPIEVAADKELPLRIDRGAVAPD